MNAFKPPPLTFMYSNLSPELCKAPRGRNLQSERQIVNKSFACICGKNLDEIDGEGNPICSLERCINVIQDNAAAVRMT